jgi:hypothetical protein
MVFNWYHREKSIGYNHQESPAEECKTCDVSSRKEILDAFLVRGVSQLSFEEREKQLEALHGITPSHNIDAEIPSTVSKLLNLLDTSLQTNKQGTVYELAESLDKSFVSDRAFRLMFLRSSRFKPKHAANRVIQFLDLKLALFGINKLVKKISMEDLNKDDMVALKSGSFQVLTKKDNAGRSIITYLPHLASDSLYENEMRARFYILMSLLESEDVQINGVIILLYGVAAKLKCKLINQGALLALPLYAVGIHYCSDNWKLYVLSRLLVFRLSCRYRALCRSHVGFHEYCQAALATFGIPRSALPLNSNNEPIIDDHLAWLKCREIMELKASPAVGPINPTSLDVLFGRGRPTQESVGNKTFRSLIEQAQTAHRYNQSSQTEKTKIAASVVKQIKSDGGRFLKNVDSKTWEEVSDTEARRKVSNAFRSQRKIAKRKEMKQGMMESGKEMMETRKGIRTLVG